MSKGLSFVTSANQSTVLAAFERAMFEPASARERFNKFSSIAMFRTSLTWGPTTSRGARAAAEVRAARSRTETELNRHNKSHIGTVLALSFRTTPGGGTIVDLRLEPLPHVFGVVEQANFLGAYTGYISKLLMDSGHSVKLRKIPAVGQFDFRKYA